MGELEQAFAQALLNALPSCGDCYEPATRCGIELHRAPVPTYRCDEHAEEGWLEMDYADAVRSIDRELRMHADDSGPFWCDNVLYSGLAPETAEEV